MDALKIISEGSIKAERPQFNVGDTDRQGCQGQERYLMIRSLRVRLPQGKGALGCPFFLCSWQTPPAGGTGGAADGKG